MTNEVTSEIQPVHNEITARANASFESGVSYAAAFAEREAFFKAQKARGVKVLRTSGKLTPIRRGDLCPEYANRFFIESEER